MLFRLQEDWAQNNVKWYLPVTASEKEIPCNKQRTFSETITEVLQYMYQGSKCLRKVRFPAFRIRELDKKC